MPVNRGFTLDGLVCERDANPSLITVSHVILCVCEIRVIDTLPSGEGCVLAGQVSPQGSYVITGGTDSIGLGLALRLARAGAGGLVLLSRYVMLRPPPLSLLLCLTKCWQRGGTR